MRTVSVDEIFHSQQSCGITFTFGGTLRQLVEELHSGLHNPLSAPFLLLEVVQYDDLLFSNDNRGLFCLKKYREESGQLVYVRARVTVMPELQLPLRRFVDRVLS